MTTITNSSEVNSWLKVVLKNENIEDFSVEVTGGTEKGDGYIGDIVFVSLTPKNNKSKQNYNFVLKCSKRSKALRENAPVETAFLNEIHVYDKVLPEFTKFQLEKGVTNVFESVPKCHGTVVTEDMEIIVFDDLGKCGYTLWEKRKPLTRRHLDLVLSEYAKFHAVSIALKDQKPYEFKKLCEGLTSSLDEFWKKTDLIEFFGKSILQVYDVLRGELDEKILEKWKSLETKVNHTFKNMIAEMNGTKVILHGDCWSNNFMFKNIDNNVLLPVKVSIIDWQISSYSSPILDVSYFLFACISKEDINNLQDILRFYYHSLNEAVEKLGSNLNISWTEDDFFNDWKKYSKYGLFLASLSHKFCSTDKDEVIDISESAEKGENFAKSFEYDVKDKTNFKNRSKHVVQYVVENDLV